MNFESATAETEYAKDPKISRDDIQALKLWVKEQPHLPDVTEFMLIQCYQVSDYNYKQCVKLVETMYDFKNQAPEIFTGLDYDVSKYELQFFDMHYQFVVPNVTYQGYRILYTGMKNNNAQNFDSLAYISMSLKTMFALVLEQGSCPGYIVISDSQDYKFGHIRKINFTAMRKLLSFVADGIPIKVKEIHIIRTHRIANYALALFRPFMNKEMNEMISLYSDMNKFFDTIPKEYVPKDLGGSLPLTRDEYNEIQRRKMIFFSDELDKELQRRSTPS